MLKAVSFISINSKRDIEESSLENLHKFSGIIITYNYKIEVKPSCNN